MEQKETGNKEQVNESVSKEKFRNQRAKEKLMTSAGTTQGQTQIYCQSCEKVSDFFRKSALFLWKGCKWGILIFVAILVFDFLGYSVDLLSRNRREGYPIPRGQHEDLVIPRMNPAPVMQGIVNGQVPRERERTSTLMRESRYEIHEVSNLVREIGRFGK